MAKKKHLKRSVSRVVDKISSPSLPSSSTQKDSGSPVEKKELVSGRPVDVSSDAGTRIVPLLITQRDLCGLLNISRSTLVRMGDSAIPGRVMVGGSIRYHKSTVEAWLLSKIESTQTHSKGD
jgi:predicted DNA-binding transcriptional regulator AlpA